MLWSSMREAVVKSGRNGNQQLVNITLKSGEVLCGLGSGMQGGVFYKAMVQKGNEDVAASLESLFISKQIWVSAQWVENAVETSGGTWR